MLTTEFFDLSLKCCPRLTEKRIPFLFSLLLLVSANIWSQRTTNVYNDHAASASVTTLAPPTEKLWPVAPAVIPPTNQDSSITLGMKFSSSVPGYVRGVRFFSSNDAMLPQGSYTGQLWSADGILLASGAFSNVTSSDWQELLFATPILISANVTYVASYHTNGTKYVGSTGGFTATITNGSLTALDNLSSGGNGVFAYGAAVTFPGNSVGANYWVDVIFSSNISRGDLR